VLIDERQGAKIARSEGLLVTETLGVLLAAADQGLDSLAAA
jgi:predicted nucleic acid-binding protein